MGGKSQRKGAAGERELAQILRGYGYSCDRGGSLPFGEVADITGLPGIYIEVKRVEKLNVCEAMEQSIQDSERNESAKRRLCPMSPGCAEYEYICKALAQKYGI